MDETWDSIADWYTRLVRDGSVMHEFSRDILLSLLPYQLAGLDVLDLGCGEGVVARTLAERGARVVGIDQSAALVAHARSAPHPHATGVSYQRTTGRAWQPSQTSRWTGSSQRCP